MKKNFVRWVKNYQIDILIWSVFIAYETVVIGIITGYFGNLLTYVFHYSINIGIFYLNALYLLPLALKNRNFTTIKLIAIIFLQVILYTVISYLTDKILIEINVIHHVDLRLNRQFVLRSLYRGLYFLGFSIGYYYLINYLQERKTIESLEREKLADLLSKNEIKQELAKARNLFLKAQINPHFLFNTLDFIYHGILTNQDNAAEAVIMLSKMMRFAIESDQQGEYILMYDELVQVGNLIDLYQLRNAQKLNIDFHYSHEASELYIIPLLLLTLVENIFKHGDISVDIPAMVSVDIINNILIIRTSNVIKNTSNAIKGYTGLSNLNKRLEFAYGEDQSFQYYAADNRFESVTKISVEILEQNANNRHLHIINAL